MPDARKLTSYFHGAFGTFMRLLRMALIVRLGVQVVAVKTE